MATAGEGRAPYESSGAGGKFRKRPFRRGGPATPYDRPATALRNNEPGLLTKLVDPASRLIYAGANKLFGVFRKRLPPLSLQGPPEINEEPQNVSQESGQNNSIGVSKRISQDGNSASISAATGISDLEQMLNQKTFTRSEIQHLTTLLHSRTTDSPCDNIAEIHGANPNPLLRIEASTSGSMKKHAAISTPFVSSKVFEESTPSPADVAKSYMGTITRPTTKLMNSTTSFQNTSITPKTANNFKNQENGFLITPRSHGRSAMYSMARTPYSRSPNQNTSHGTSLKRRSSVLEDDFGSVGPLRRTRQKPNLMLQSKKELGYTISQQPMLLKNKPEENGDTIMSKSKSTHVSVPEKSTQTAMKIFQQLESLTPKSPTKLTSNMLHGQALRSLEKVDSVKYLQTSQCNGESASTSRGKEKVEENGSRKFPVPFNMLTTSTNGNGDVAVSKESAQVVAIDDDDDESALKLPPEPPQKKRAFQMSAPEIDDDDDDDVEDDDIIHVNGHVSFPPVENNKKLETSPVVNKPVTADIIEVTTPPEVFKTPAPVEATPVVVEAAKVLEPEKAKPPPKTDGFFGEKETGFKFSSTFTAQKDEVTPTEKVSPFQFSEYKPKESSEPKPIESTSVFSSEAKNDQLKVTNTDDKKVEAIPAATSASGMFSFASSAKNSNGPTVTPDSTPSVFSSLASFPASGGNTSSLFNNTSSSNITTTSSLSSPPPVFSFGSGKAITSMPESSNTEAVIEKEPKSTISSSSPFFAATTTAAATTSSGGGFFGFSSPAAASTAATTTTTTNGGGLFGFSSPAASSTTAAATTTNGGGALFGFSAPATTSTTTTAASTATNAGALFGFSAPAATSTTTPTANGGAPFGFSSPAATSTTTTTTSTATNAGALFAFGAPAATSTTATATNGGSPFGFSAPATTSTTAAAATNGGSLFGFGAPPSTSNATSSGALFGFSAPATTSTTTTSTTTASPLFGFSSPSPTTTPTNSFNTTTTTSQTNPSSSTTTTQSAPFQFASGPTTSPAFGITPVSEGKSGNSTTTTVFGSSWQQPPPQNPPVFSFGASSSASTTPITFGAPKTTPSSSSSSMFSFSSSSPVFPNHITNGNDQMSMEDSMAEDSMQTPTPVPSPFAQPAVAPGFMFGAPAAAPAPAPFQFGGAAAQNPFQSSSVEFNGGGGSFSLGSGGEKAGRRIVRVNKSKNRRK